DGLRAFFKDLGLDLEGSPDEAKSVLAATDYDDPPKVAIRSDEGTHFLYLGFSKAQDKTRVKYDARTDVSKLVSRVVSTLEPHRMGLLQARLRSRLQAKGFGSFTQFSERVLKVDPSGPGMQLLIDLSTVNHTAFFREPAHFTSMAEHVVALLKEGS